MTFRSKIVLVFVFVVFSITAQQDSILFYLKKDINDSLKFLQIESYTNRILRSGNLKKAETKIKNAISYYSSKDKDLVVDYNTLLSKFYFNVGEFQKSIVIENNNIDFALKNNLEEKTGYSFYILTVNYLSIGDIKNAKVFADKAIAGLKNGKQQRFYAKAIVTRGLIEFYEGKYSTANDYYLQALKIQEKNELFSDVADTYNNMAIIYAELNDLVNAIKYQKKALAYSEKIKSKNGRAMSLGNIGTMYYKMDLLDSAKYYQELSLPLAEKLSNKTFYINTLGNLASIYSKKNEKDKFLEYNQKVIELSKEYSMIYQYCQATSAHAKFLLDEGKYDEAEIKARETLKIALKEDFAVEKADSYRFLFKIEQTKKNFEKALEYELEYQKIKSSLDLGDQKKDVLRKTFQYEYNKKALADSVIHAEEKRLQLAEINASNAMLKSEKTIKYALYSGLVLIIVFSIFIFNRLSVTQKQKNIISLQKKEVEEQKSLIEEKQKEIVDSINYAKRIQYTLLAHEDILKEGLKDHFVLFKPKDIVSGDFYWATKKDNRFYLAVCDCTGHGVPGAFMSLLNISFLNEAINEKNISEPHEVFNHVRQRLIENISQNGGQDGMDGILVCIDTLKKTLTYSAANNSPVLINGNEITELPKDKMPVGKGERINSFTLQSIEIKKGDVLYLYTDGFADQFGGPKGKKYKYKQLNSQLLAINSLSMKEQAKELINNFDTWKGNLEQVDDVCVVGISL